MSACSPMLELIEVQHIDPHAKELLVEELSTEESSEEFYVETSKPVETEKYILSLSLSCV